MSLVNLLSLLLSLLFLHHFVLSSEDADQSDYYYTARLPNGKNFTYNTGEGYDSSYWNRTTAEEEIFDAHNEARRELNLTALVSMILVYEKIYQI